MPEAERYLIDDILNSQPVAQCFSSPESNCRGLRSGSLWRGITQDYLPTGPSTAGTG